MADELNTPTHRWHEPRNNISLPKTDFSAQTIYDSGIQKIDAWINSQPWGSPVPGLFALAEPGVWYDPSDLTTLFQDSAGTTPVTAAGQPVGLMLDKSRGAAAGTELITDGQFASSANWTFGSGWTVGGGQAVKTAGTATNIRQAISVTEGRLYRIVIQSTLTAGVITPWFMNNLSQAIVAGAPVTSGFSVQYLTAPAGATQIGFLNDAAFAGTIRSISVKEIAGVHAFQGTAASRPIYQIDGAGRPYLLFDGVDDFLVTGTITPGTDKVQAFAGIRKLVDTVTAAVLVESSATAASNTGTFWLLAPASGATQAYQVAARGSGTLVTRTSLAAPAPHTAVVTGLADIAAPSLTLRTNTVELTGAQTLGTGDFLAYPLYIGRRAGTTLPFNGQLYGLVVRFGPNMSAGTITATENWLNTKTGAY